MMSRVNTAPLQCGPGLGTMDPAARAAAGKTLGDRDQRSREGMCSDPACSNHADRVERTLWERARSRAYPTK
jgi:hypothetical protein